MSNPGFIPIAPDRAELGIVDGVLNIKIGKAGVFVPISSDVSISVLAPLTGTGTPGDPFTVAPATQSTAGSISGPDKTKMDGLIEPAAGTALTNADVTVSPSSLAISASVLPASTLTANHALTIGVAGSPVTNHVYQVVRRDLSAHTYTVKDDAGTVLYAFPASPPSAQGASFYFNGTHYAFLSFYYVA